VSLASEAWLLKETNGIVLAAANRPAEIQFRSFAAGFARFEFSNVPAGFSLGLRLYGLDGTLIGEEKAGKSGTIVLRVGVGRAPQDELYLGVHAPQLGERPCVHLNSSPIASQLDRAPSPARTPG